MTNRRHMGWVAGAATMLAAAPLSLIFESWTWFGQCLLVVAAIAGVATLTRWLRGPVWAQLAAMAGTLLLLLTWFYPSGKEIGALIPTPGTFTSFGNLLTTAVDEMRSYSVPVPDRRGLLFLTVLGVGGVAIVVDALTVSLRRPALAGLPMLAIYSVPVAVYPDSVPPVPFVIGACGFLWLLVADNVDKVRRFGRRFTGDGRDVDVWEPSPLAAAGRRLTIVGVVVAVLLPLAVPGMGAGLLDTLGSGGNGDGPGRGGRGRPVDLFADLSGRLNNSRIEEMIKITTNDPNPSYLRFATADQVTEQGFRARPLVGNTANKTIEGSFDQRQGLSVEQFHANVEITSNFVMQMLPVFTPVTSIKGIENSWRYDRGQQVIYSNSARVTAAKKKYEFDFLHASYEESGLRDAQPLGPTDPIRRDFTSVPPNKEARVLVDRLTKGKTTDYDKVRALRDHFSTRNGFKYRLQTAKGTDGNALVNFLKTKEGFCEQYAAALTWLVRQANIPARVAFGFTRGSNRSGDTYTLTNKNLHAWTEVYFNGFGWVLFDATPSSGVAGSYNPSYSPEPGQTPDNTPSTDPGNPSIGPGGVAPTRSIDPRLEGPDVTGGGAGAQAASPVPWWIAGGIALALALLTVPALLRALLRRRRRVRKRPVEGAVAVTLDDGTPPGEFVVLAKETAGAARARADAHAAWEELLDTLVDYRVRVDPAETPRSTAERLAAGAGMPADAGDGARMLGRAEERARYARDPVQVPQLGSALRTVRRALAGQARRRTRIAAVLMPPSVLQRWKLALVEGGTRTVLAFSRMRDVMIRLSPRRALASRAAAR